MHKGLFVDFEGIEGVGKTTQRDLAYDHFKKAGTPVISTREPGGTPLAEKIRDILKYYKDEPISTLAEIYLFYTSRELHLNNVIRPHLEENSIVLCDRFADTTEAYQLAGGNGNQELISLMRKNTVGDTEPDLTFVFVMDIDAAFLRAAARGELDRLESKGRDYFVAAQEHFVKLAHQPNSPTNYVIVDADRPIEVIQEQIISEILLAWDRKHGKF